MVKKVLIAAGILFFAMSLTFPDDDFKTVSKDEVPGTEKDQVEKSLKN